MVAAASSGVARIPVAEVGEDVAGAVGDCRIGLRHLGAPAVTNSIYAPVGPAKSRVTSDIGINRRRPASVSGQNSYRVYKADAALSFASTTMAKLAISLLSARARASSSTCSPSRRPR